MPKNVDPDQLNRGVEYDYSTTTPSARTFALIAAGNLDNASPGVDSGATGQAAYSRMVLDYAEATTAGRDLRKHTFPLRMTTESQGAFNASWGPADDATRNLFRDFGWTEPDGKEFAAVFQLGQSGASDQARYQQAPGGTSTVTPTDKTGRLNEAIRIDGATSYLQLRLREQGKTHSGFELVRELQLSALQPRLYSILLSNAPDSKVTTSDGDIDTLAPFTGMSADWLTASDHDAGITWASTAAKALGDLVKLAGTGRWLRCTAAGTTGGSEPSGPGVDGSVTWESDPGERQVGSTWHHFSRIIDGNDGTVQQVQNWGQRQLRKATDINADTNLDAFGAVNGLNAEEFFVQFRGEVLVMETGVFVDSLAASDKNLILLQPHSLNGTSPGEIANPFKNNLELTFSANMVGGQATVYFTNDDAGDNAARDFDTDDAIVVEDDTATPMDFTIGSTLENKTYDFDANVQRGAASAGLSAPITVQAIKAGSSIAVVAVATITRIDNVPVRVIGSDDPNFSNPAP
jgi:hypothetical protein